MQTREKSDFEQQIDDMEEYIQKVEHFRYGLIEKHNLPEDLAVELQRMLPTPVNDEYTIDRLTDIYNELFLRVRVALDCANRDLKAIILSDFREAIFQEKLGLSDIEGKGLKNDG